MSLWSGSGNEAYWESQLKRPFKKCDCRYADASECGAVYHGAGEVACSCRCHASPEPAPSEPSAISKTETTPSQMSEPEKLVTEESRRLVDDCCNASFDCGHWDEEDGTLYGPVLHAESGMPEQFTKSHPEGADK